ncbi:hypothetical protein JTE90_006293 [Oedothorax gibbosus]|uniref:Protein kinase domain-containing protein n=1 Tax=Oedothorax gibbosus TaxID=931172 RepID=A0AAV6U231_9ARAC|nr:hypothetical protein JTE90_006293 [Oedothorax gibbosus]
MRSSEVNYTGKEQICVKINGRNCVMEVDSGSEYSIISESTFNRLFVSKPKLHRDLVHLQDFQKRENENVNEKKYWKKMESLGDSVSVPLVKIDYQMCAYPPPPPAPPCPPPSTRWSRTPLGSGSRFPRDRLVLGEGAFGQVVQAEARDEDNTNRVVAVKMLKDVKNGRICDAPLPNLEP